MSYFFSPVSVICFIATLFIIYTSIIWSAEFETPPETIEEYRGWLRRLQLQMSIEERARTLDSSDLELLPVPGPSWRQTGFANPTYGEQSDQPTRKQNQSNVEVHSL